jgi:integrase
MYLFLVTNGWSSTLAKYRPKAARQADPSIGQFIKAVAAVADIEPRTLKGYIGALRKITADIAGLADDPRKFGSGRGHREWIERVDSVKLSELTPKGVQEWKRAFIGRAEPDPVSQRSARVSVNSFLRCARSLFGANILEHIELELPDPLPFADVQFEPKQNSKYRSDFDIQKLIAAARDELAANDPECFKIFLLATFAGLRRAEIDLLEWTSFLWDSSAIRIEATRHFSAKSEDSYSDVPIDPEVLELFRGYRARATGAFVIESPEAFRPGLLYNFYRCDAELNRLTDWLRAKGVKAQKPLHTLRKEFGSQLCQAHGIYAASRGLRHSDIKITSNFYTDSRARATVGLGHLLEAPKVVPFKEVA